MFFKPVSEGSEPKLEELTESLGGSTAPMDDIDYLYDADHYYQRTICSALEKLPGRIALAPYVYEQDKLYEAKEIILE
jgi:hypothetical protein